MQRTRMCLALVSILPFVLTGCEHAMWGNCTALGMTFCLFFGTLQLGHRSPTPRTDATNESSAATK